MKFIQINSNRGLILKSSIKKIIIDSSIENTSAFNDIIITHLSFNTINIIQNNSSKYTRINLSYELMLLMQKFWQNQIISKPKVMPIFRILPINYPANLGTQFKITVYKNDDGLNGSIACIIDDVNTKEKIGYVPNFITKGIHKNRIKIWKKEFKNKKLNQFISFNNNINNKSNIIKYYESKTMMEVQNDIENNYNKLIQKWIEPFNTERMININNMVLNNKKRLIWSDNYAHLLHFYYPTEKIYFQSNNFHSNNQYLVNIKHEKLKNSDIIQKNIHGKLNIQLKQYKKNFINTIPQNEFKEIINIINARESILI